MGRLRRVQEEDGTERWDRFYPIRDAAAAERLAGLERKRPQRTPWRSRMGESCARYRDVEVSWTQAFALIRAGGPGGTMVREHGVIALALHGLQQKRVLLMREAELMQLKLHARCWWTIFRVLIWKRRRGIAGDLLFPTKAGRPLDDRTLRRSLIRLQLKRGMARPAAWDAFAAVKWPPRAREQLRSFPAAVMHRRAWPEDVDVLPLAGI